MRDFVAEATAQIDDFFRDAGEDPSAGETLREIEGALREMQKQGLKVDPEYAERLRKEWASSEGS